MLFSTSALAYDVSSADYRTSIIITNTAGSTQYDKAVTFWLSTEEMITGGMINSDADDVVMLSGSGANVAVQPAVNSTYPWCTYADSIGASATQNYYLYTGGASGGNLYYFPGEGGMTVYDDVTLEPGSDMFSIYISGALNTDAGSGKYIWWHGDTIQCYVDNSTDEKINAVICDNTLSAINVDNGEHEIIVALEIQ